MGNTQTQQPLEMTYCDLSGQNQQAMMVIQLYMLPAFFLGVLGLGLPLNLLSLWVFSRRLKRWSRGTAFLFNLALADTSWLLILPFLVQYHLAQMNWTLGWQFCTAVRLVYHSYFYLSIFFVTCISVDRYAAIVHPLRSLALLGRRPTSLLCISIWGFTLAFSSPVALMTLTQRCPRTNHTICTMYVLLENTRQSLPFSLYWSCVGFLLPLAAIGYCCCRSVQELRRRPGLQNRRGRHLTRVLSIALVLFALFYLPYHLTRNAAIVVRAVHPWDQASWGPADVAFSLEMCLCSLNTCVNPLFSCSAGRQFRQEFWGIFSRLCQCGSNPRPAAALQERALGPEEHGTAAVWAEGTACLTHNWFPSSRENVEPWRAEGRQAAQKH
ncbi:succinate receptor 1-like [Paramormyrops kingsleyae]|uniref:succinate receptor 1-like n=1 Tax=Paramormyrops kingsleyae TaxID=1676925 RepID=UPI003B9795F8